jgi:uncharacterized protein (DUF2342 family)
MSDLPFGFGMSNPEPGKPFDMSQLGAALQQLGAMLQSGAQPGATSEGPVNWVMVHDVARQALSAAGDPSVSESDQSAVADAMRLADLWLDSVVTFPASGATAVAWSRSEWLEATLPAWKVIVAPIAEQMQQAMGKQGGGSFDLESLQQNLPEQLRAMLPDGIPPEMAQMLQPMMAIVQSMVQSLFTLVSGEESPISTLQKFSISQGRLVIENQLKDKYKN